MNKAITWAIFGIIIVIGIFFGMKNINFTQVSFSQACAEVHFASMCRQASPFYQYGGLIELKDSYEYKIKNGITFWNDQAEYNCEKINDGKLVRFSADMNKLLERCG